VRLLLPQFRALSEETFRTVLAGLNGQKRLRIRYRSRSRDEDSQRTVWCHRSGDLRVFSVDRIADAELTPLPNEAIAERDLEARLSTGYGIFEGQADKVAKLKFTSESARWIADELWHPGQRLERRADGSVILHVPYRHAKELVMDVLRHGADVEVLAPAALRQAVTSAHARAAAQYSEPAG
jgi:predicted DNA-binding transcriptional regulator YafY